MRDFNLRLHIDELVLHGFPYGSRYEISTTVERELTNLFLRKGVPISLAEHESIRSLDAGKFEVSEGADAEGIGTQVAHQIYAGLGG